MNTKGVVGKSPRRPMTKEVFPHDMERKRVSGTVIHKPTTSLAAKRQKSGVKGEETGSVFVAKGTTVRATPKSRTTKKAPLKAKENLSTNQTKSRIASKSSILKTKSAKEYTQLKVTMAIRIQKWWREILQERENLRQKLIAARKALQEHKMKLLDRQPSHESPTKQASEQNSSFYNPDINRDLIAVQNSEHKRGVDVLQTACFGQFKLPNEALLEAR